MNEMRTCSSVDRAVVSGTMCGGSIPFRCVGRDGFIRSGYLCHRKFRRISYDIKTLREIALRRMEDVAGAARRSRVSKTAQRSVTFRKQA